MEYRSLQQLQQSIERGLLPMAGQFDLVVGVPRSGLLAGFMAAQVLDVPLTDLDGLATGHLLYPHAAVLPRTSAKLRVLVLEDSVQSGGSLMAVRERLKAWKDCFSFTVCAVYGREAHHDHADLVLEVVPIPRLFEWNALHHSLLDYGTVDLDEVILGADWSGGALLGRPTAKIGFALTCQERSKQSEINRCLEESGISIGRLIFLDPKGDTEDRARRKAKAFARLHSFLYVARQEATAAEAARYTGKPALCLDTQVLHIAPPNFVRRRIGALQAAALEQMYLRPSHLRGWYWKQRIRQIIGEGASEGVKRLLQRPVPGVGPSDQGPKN